MFYKFLALRGGNSTGGGSGCDDCLPDVSEADNGRLLMVENGEWRTVSSTRFAKNAINITSFGVSPNKVEIGRTIEAVTLTWAINMTPASLTLDGTTIDPKLTTKSLSGLGLKGTKTWTLKATDDQGEAVSKSVSISFLNGVYHGAIGADATIDSAAINALSVTLQSGIAGTFKFTGAAGQKMTFAAPADYGEPSKFVIGGLDYIWTKVATFNHKNNSGHTESYNVWQNSEVLTGSRTLDITVKK